MGDAKKTYNLLPCKTEDYEKYTEVLNKIFNKKEDSWFIKYLPHIFPEVGDKQYEHLIPYSMYFLDGNEIMSTIGIYPLQMHVSYGEKTTVLSIGGIGSVGTVEKYRGMGLMSQMLNQVNEKLVDDGYDISWLGGDRYRYKNYGWDLGGRVVNFTVNAKDIKRLYNLDNETIIYKADKNHIKKLDNLYTRYSSRVIRDEMTWKAQLKRKALEINMALDDDKNPNAYIVSSMDNPKYIVELQGDEKSIVNLLAKYMDKNELDNLVVCYPYSDDEMFNILHHICGYYSTQNLHQIKVVDVESTWEKLQPLVREQVKKMDCNELLGLFDSIETYEEKKAILDITFSSFDVLVKLPDRISKLKILKPLNWWIPFTNFV